MANLTETSVIDDDPADHVRRCGTVLREFNHLTQDSGNVSWLVECAGTRLFVKTAGTGAPPPPGAPTPYLDHSARITLLRNAIALSESCEHPALARLLNVIETPVGTALVYAAVPGDSVGVPTARRGDPVSPYQRFARLPSADLLRLFDTLIDLHVALAAVGWQAGDLYDGCLIVDWRGPALHVVDLDTYRSGAGVNDMGQMFGSSRFMAPEEFELGARLDERTTVFTLGRLVWHFATRLTERRETFCGRGRLAEVVEQACAPAPADRHPSVADLARCWSDARRGRA